MSDAVESSTLHDSQSQEYSHSEERYRALFLQEQTRARHLSLINEVQKCALLAQSAAAFLRQVVQAIGSHFSDCRVSIRLSEAERVAGNAVFTDTAPVDADADDSGNDPRLAALAERAAQTQRTQYLDTAPGAHENAAKTGCGMCVPIVANAQALGAICMTSARRDAIEGRDAVALQTAAAIIASRLEAERLTEQTRELSAFNQTLINTMVHSLMAVDRSGFITLVNERLSQTLGKAREDLLWHPIESVFGQSAQRLADLRAAIKDVAQNGTPYELPEIQIAAPSGRLVFDIRLFRVYFRGQAQTVLLLINITRRWRMVRQLTLLNGIWRLFGASLNINQVLHTVLTCVTAGAGLGFNRAFLLLCDEGSTPAATRLYGAMALGPSSAQEAGRIWSALGSQDLTLEQILENAPPLEEQTSTPLQQQALALEMDLKNPCFPVLAQALEQRRARRVRRDELIGEFGENPAGDCAAQREKARALFTAPEAAIAPLIAKDRVVGVIVADNLYSGAPIEASNVYLLDALAQQAGMTIANALTYQALQLAQREVVGAERLAAVGEMAARVSHEIRNPLATVGGFARSIAKNPHDAQSVARKTGIIIDEVARLEELLNDLLDMAHPRALDLQLHSMNAIIEYALLLAESEIVAHATQIEKQFDDTLPPILCDRARVLQAILNILRNGAQAMPQGGVLCITTRRSDDGKYLQVVVRDSGAGISDNTLKHVFDPFFSTKLKGSGLGLAITRRIVQDHSGEIDVHSEPGEGTTFILNWPLQTATEHSDAR
jgi:signal transduction histidine kinase